MNSYNAYGKMGTSSDIILNLPFVKDTYRTHLPDLPVTGVVPNNY